MVSTLHSGLEIALLIALLSATLRGNGQRGLLPLLLRATLVSVFVSLGLAYAVVTAGDRETVEALANAAAVLLAMALVVCLGRTIKHGAPEQPEGESGLFQRFVVFLAPAALAIVPGLDIGLTQGRLLFGAGGDGSAEFAARLATGLAILTFAGVAGLAVYRATARTRPKWVVPFTLAAVFLLLVRDATTAVQVMLARGMIPLADWLFRIMVPLVNNYHAFFYGVLGLVGGLVLIAVWEWRRRQDAGLIEGLNPAQKRKKKAEDRRVRGQLGLASALMALVVLGDVSSTALANRPVKLSPATPVEAEDGRITIPVQSVSDGRLHRFSFAAGQDSTVRFLVLYKGSGIYGVGLDACEFCGVAGYREEGDNVICNRCNAAINKTTIGFPGGCNPIPLDHLVEGDSVVVPLEGVVAVKALFAR